VSVFFSTEHFGLQSTDMDLRRDKSAPAPSIVRQENVEIVTDPTEVDEALLFAAGRYFKRFDRDSCTFISNVKEQFPDD
jgi:hypothetical protein